MSACSGMCPHTGFECLPWTPQAWDKKWEIIKSSTALICWCEAWLVSTTPLWVWKHSMEEVLLLVGPVCATWLCALRKTDAEFTHQLEVLQKRANSSLESPSLGAKLAHTKRLSFVFATQNNMGSVTTLVGCSHTASQDLTHARQKCVAHS